ILRHRQLGHSLIESAKRGASEVGLAVSASTTTTLVVFVPMFFMEAGRMSVFMKELAIPLAVSLLGSLLIALTLAPLTMSRMKERGAPLRERLHLLREQGGGGSGIIHFRMFQGILHLYGYVLNAALHRRFAAFVLLAAVLVLTYRVPFTNMEMQEMPRLDTREVDIRVEFDQNFDENMATDVFNRLENELDRRRDLLGIKNVFKFYNASGGKFEVYLYTSDDGPEWDSPLYSTNDVMDILSRQFPRFMPGVELTFSIADAERAESDESVAVQFRGDNSARLQRYAEAFRTYMEQIDGLKDVKTDVEKSSQEMQLRIDGDIAERAGVSPLVVAQTVDAALRGARLPYMKQGGREIPVWAQFQEENRKSKENLDNIIVIGEGGRPMPVNQLVNYSKALSPSSIHRYNGKNTVMVSATATVERLNRIKYELTRLARMFDLPAGYTIELSEHLAELESNWFSFTTSLLMAVVLVYLVMASLFESYVLPLSILFTVPLSFIGVLWLFFLTGTPFDVVTLIGCILMVGLIVNNGIVIVDHINQLRLRGLDRTAAILQGGRDRFRPVMMTAITTILGCLPLALTTSGGGVTFQGLGRAVVGGMTVGTILTLVIVPVVYSVLDDLTAWLRAFLAGLVRRSRPVIS
ncbi:MAG TPA: efflux RND transporter permease subunit, partial [Candidatus Hydrogenedentes bacterium]|nr:efflux RND transporter permease subunit [Candidatus Hydrogenedentota bacterium]